MTNLSTSLSCSSLIEDLDAAMSFNKSEEEKDIEDQDLGEGEEEEEGEGENDVDEIISSGRSPTS